MLKLILVYFTTVLFLSSAQAGPCCGQATAQVPVSILRQKVSLQMLQSEIFFQGRVYDSSDFYVFNSEKSRRTSSTQMNVTALISERLQGFLSSGFLQSNLSSSGQSMNGNLWTDTQVGLSYELNPEYTYSRYVPTFYLSLIANLPTGDSVFKTGGGPEGVEVSGHEQWGYGFGLSMAKKMGRSSVFLQYRVLNLLKTKFQETEVQDFWDQVLMFNVMYDLNILNMKAFTGFSHVFLSSRTIKDLSDSQTENIKVPKSNSLALNLGFLVILNDSINLSFNYSDQTLLGEPRNTMLGRSAQLGLVYNYF